MNIYIAAPWELKEEARKLAKRLEEKCLGAICNPQWFDHKEGDDLEECIKHDLEDIQESRIFILLNPEDWKYKGTGGRHFEAGFAYAYGKDICILGVKTNLFHNHPDINVYSNEEDLIYWINS
jgi:nucleoside 2-deoxyribosyltransferase